MHLQRYRGLLFRINTTARPLKIRKRGRIQLYSTRTPDFQFYGTGVYEVKKLTSTYALSILGPNLGIKRAL